MALDYIHITIRRGGGDEDVGVARAPHLQLYSHQSGNLKTLIVMVARRREISPEMVKSPPILNPTTTILLLSLPQHSSMIMRLMCNFAPLGGKACIPKRCQRHVFDYEQ